MYTVTICIVCASIVVALAVIVFAAAVVVVTISHSAGYTAAALRSLWSGRIPASLAQGRLSPGLVPRRVRQE